MPMKMRKIVAIVAAALMLFSIMPFSAMAADTQVVFNMGANGTATHADGSKYSAYTEDADGYTLTLESLNNVYGPARDAMGNGCIKLGASSKAGGFSFTVPADVTSVIIAVGKYKANATKLTVNGTAYTLTKNSNDGAYDEIVIDTTTEKTISLTTVSGGYRAMVNSITYVIPAGNADCDHSQYTCGDTCEVCGEVFVHEYSKPCTEVCDNGCGTVNPDAVAHTYTHSLATFCSVCGDERTVVMPTDPAELVDAAYALPANEAFPEAVTLTGIISSVDTAFDSSYNNVTVTIDVLDSEGNVIADKPIQCFRLKGTGADLIGEGDTITVSGIIVNYNGSKIEFNSGCTLVSYEQTGCEHQYEFECSTTCQLCGKGEREAACVTDAQFACADGLCVYCGNDVNALEHTFDDEWDPDCNYGCGYTREVEEKPDMTEATLDFSTLDQRTEYSTSIQVWTNGALVLTNNKGGSTSNVGDYYNPARFYKGSEIVIAYPGMTKLVIVANTSDSGKYSTPWAATLEAAGLTYTVDGGVYTVTFAAPVDSITLTTTAQVRANSMTATAVKTGDDECNHVWVDATCTAPKTCSICGAVEGTVLDHDWEIISQVDATCTADGSIVYECAACGEDKSETFPAIPHNYVDGICSACGAELPLQATITFDADKTQRTEFTTETQKWEHDGLVLINNKAESTNPIGDYAGRMYKNSEIIISFPGMTSLVIDATGVGTDYLWEATLADLTYTVEEKVYTITFAEPTDSITLTAANQVRANSITATRVEEKVCKHENTDYLYTYHDTNDDWHKYIICCDDCGENLSDWIEEACSGGTATCTECAVCEKCGLNYGDTLDHEYFTPCDQYCMICGELTNPEASHNVVHVEAVAPTCAAMGNIEYWYCDVCGQAWLDEACTLNTNLRAVVLPATGEHTYDDDYDADCNVCGETREVPEMPVEIIYGDADGDGEVTLTDAALLGQWLAGYEVTVDEAAADADGDGEITLTDAALLGQWLAGYDVTLGPETTEPPTFNDATLGWE